MLEVLNHFYEREGYSCIGGRGEKSQDKPFYLSISIIESNEPLYYAEGNRDSYKQTPGRHAVLTPSAKDPPHFPSFLTDSYCTGFKLN